MRGKRIGMVFQDPLTSLNPLYRVGDQIVETIRRTCAVGKAQARERAIDLLQEVGIPAPERRIDGYPHEFSGGMRQRVVLALALCARARAGDRRRADHGARRLVQAQIITLLKRLCRERGTAVMLITHDMGVIAETADRVAVMYAGRIAEIGPVREVVQRAAPPLHRGSDGGDPDAGGRGRAAGADPRLHAAPGRDPAGLRLPPALPASVLRAAAAVERPELLTRKAGPSAVALPPAPALPRRAERARRTASRAVDRRTRAGRHVGVD